MSQYLNKRIYDIFVSATVRDLKHHREAAWKTIARAGHRPNGMESFGARPDQAESFIYSCIRESDIFLIILGRNAGTLIEGKPYVSKEYEYARSLRKPILAFLVNEDEANSFEMTQGAKLFRETVLNSGGLVDWYNFDDVKGFELKVLSAILNQTTTMERSLEGGWIRSEDVKDFIHRNSIPSYLSKSIALNSLIEPIYGMDGLIGNLDKNVHEKIAASNHLLHSISVALSAESGINRIFVDGGSTTFYFCKLFNSYCQSNGPFLHRKDKKRIVIGTNSIIAFLEFSLNSPQGTRSFKSLRLYPSPPFSKDYGKSFGDLGNVFDESEYSYEASNWTLAQRARSNVDHSVTEFRDWLDRDGGRGIVIISVAAFLTNGKNNGPWVKNHSSMLQQQSMFRSGRPIAIILDPDKWEKRLGKLAGYPVLFDGISWEGVCQESPIAVSISTYAPELAAEIENYFRKLGMNVIEDISNSNESERKMYSVFAFNEKFKPLVVR